MKVLNSKKVFCFILVAILGLMLINAQEIWAVKKKSGPTEIQFAAKDGFNLVGVIDIPKNKSVKNKLPLVIFLHSLGRNNLDWYGYPEKVKEMGAATLSMDLRGHGKSILNKKNKRRYWPAFKNKDFQKYPDDIISTINYVRQQYPEINTSKVAVIAADVSANAAIIAASQNNRTIKTLVLISPSLSYKGLETRIPLVGYGKNPVLLMASRKDKMAFEDSSELIKYVQGYKVLKVFPEGGGGMDMLRFQPQAKNIVNEWLKNHFINAK